MSARFLSCAPKANYDSALHDLQTAIEDQIRILLVDSDTSVKRALLSNMTSLCMFLGKQRVDDVLLSHMITYLNGRDWMLRRYDIKGRCSEQKDMYF